MTILRDQDHASDACQNCFLKIVKNIDKYRGDGSFRGWALTIARNESLGFLRRCHYKNGGVKGEKSIYQSARETTIDSPVED